MNNKDYRELQLSSTQLVFIFVVVLILGLVIFLLGVSVGKKQTQIVADTKISAEKKPEIKLEEKVPETPQKPVEKPKDTISKELESHQKIQEEAQKPVTPPRNLYYIQLGAFSKRENALSLADQYKKKGYTTRVVEPSASDRTKLYKVWVGGYATNAEAERMRAKLTEESKSKERYLIIRD